MAVPKSKISKSRRNQRRAHDALAAGSYHECSNCTQLAQRFGEWFDQLSRVDTHQLPSNAGRIE